MTTVVTTRLAPRAPIIEQPDAAWADTWAERRTRRTLTFLLFADIFLQRLAVPVAGTQVPLLLPITLVTSGLMLARGDLVVTFGRTRAYLVTMTVCCAVGLVAFLRHLDDAASTSLLLLLVTYVPFCFGLRGPTAAKLLPQLLDRFIAMTTVVAMLAIVQFGIQLAGWTYSDLLGDALPPDLVLGGFSTSYPVRYGSDLHKSNAFLMLEPSFCSQFLAMGTIAAVLRGRRWWRYPLFILALGTTVSGTGVLLIGAGIILLAFHRGPRFAVAALAVVGAVVTVTSLTPASKIYAERATEVSSENSSGSLRFVEPYERMWEQLGVEDAAMAMFGAGPGWADRDAEDVFLRTGLPLNYAMPPKAIIEYGAVGAVALFYFILFSFARGTRSFVLSGAVLVFYTVLSGGLLGPVVIYLGMLLVTWFSKDTPELTVRRWR